MAKPIMPTPPLNEEESARLLVDIFNNTLPKEEMEARRRALRAEWERQPDGSYLSKVPLQRRSPPGELPREETVASATRETMALARVQKQQKTRVGELLTALGVKLWISGRTAICPGFKHECPSCAFLGCAVTADLKAHDLYTCPQGGLRTYIERYGHDAGEYTSSSQPAPGTLLGVAQALHEEGPLFTVTAEDWWAQVGTLPAHCKALRAAFSVYLTPGFYSAFLSEDEYQAIIREVGKVVVLEGERLLVVWEERQLKLRPEIGA